MRPFAPLLASVIACAALATFLMLDERQIGPVAWLAALLVVAVITSLFGYWLAGKRRGMRWGVIVIGALCPMAWITLFLAPINVVIRWSAQSYTSAICLFVLFVIAIGLAVVGRRIVRSAEGGL